MCGVAGTVDLQHRRGASDLGAVARRMADALSHRGPDSSGVWVDPEAGVALGHRRLAIIDLSEEGHQPMASASGRYVITYNGEIYNFRAIGRELADLGWRFRGHSDTEILLAAVDQWGIEAALAKLAGMFAFALWDRDSRTIHLVRDRLGKKPMYFGWAGTDFLFASELKAFHEHPDFAPEVERGALALFLRHGYIPAPHSIYAQVFKLPPASWLAVPVEAQALPRSDLRDRLRSYWSARDVAERGLAEPVTLAEGEAVDQVDQLIRQAVAERMIADVPLGALLSGGIDSSTVVALMQQQARRPVKTFSIGFHESGYDEAADAQRVARHLGTDHTQLYVMPDQARAVIPRLPEIYDEPFADRSQIPTFLVAQLARQRVTVALSGDGGDEVFGGYNRHFYGPWLWRRLKPWPRSVRHQAARLLAAATPSAWDRVANQVYRFLPRSSRQPVVGYRIQKLAGLLAVDGPQAMYRTLTSYWDTPAALVIDGSEPPTVLRDLLDGFEETDFTTMMMYFDAITYLPEDVLAKVDRASMAVNLEVRAPLLDYRLMEFVWRLPVSMKVRQRQGKWALRQVLDRYVPRELVDRPKQGFDVPVDDWLRGPLRDWAAALLDPQRLKSEGFLRAEPIQAVWAEHMSGARDRSWALWTVLMFQAWRERWCKSPPSAQRSVALSHDEPGLGGVSAARLISGA